MYNLCRGFSCCQHTYVAVVLILSLQDYRGLWTKLDILGRKLPNLDEVNTTRHMQKQLGNVFFKKENMVAVSFFEARTSFFTLIYVQ